MYSKKLSLSAFFCIILYLAPLISAFPGTGYYGGSDGQLSYNYYANSCPHLQSMVSWAVGQATKKDTRIAASLLRLHFHDCFVNGCDASVLLQDTKTFIGEQNALPNKNSIRGFEVIDAIKADAETYCTAIVSCADILTLAAREAVFQSGGPYYVVPLGRLDGLTANLQSANEQLPSPLEPVENITAKFVAKGLDMKDMVALSGAHTLGFAQCFIFKARLYNFNGTDQPDPSLNPTLLPSLQQSCPNIDNSSTNLVPLDPRTPYVFDNTYYKNIMNNAGLLQSDQALMSDPQTAAMAKVYSAMPSLFMKDFAAAMVKLGNIEVITKGGNIRKQCGFLN